VETANLLVLKKNPARNMEKSLIIATRLSKFDGSDRNVFFRFRHRGGGCNGWADNVARSGKNCGGGSNSFANRASRSDAPNYRLLVRNDGLEYPRGINRRPILRICRCGQTCDNQ